MKGVKKLLGVFGIIACVLFLIPNSVRAAEMSAEFKKVLNDKTQYIVDCAPPTDDYQFDMLVNEYSLLQKGLTDYSVANCNSSYTLCEMTYWANDDTKETHNIEVVYKYDKTIKQMIDGYVNRIPANKKEFEVRDLELINFWLNGQGNSKYITNYSSELKEYFDYKNFVLDAKRGTSSPFVTGRGGLANFTYNNTIYYLINGFEVTANHILYVSNETENTPEAIQTEAQRRIVDYTGNNDIEVIYTSTARDYWLNDMYIDTQSEWSQVEPNLTFEEFKNSNYYTDNGNFSEAFYQYYGLGNVLEDDYVYDIAIPIDENSGDCYTAIIRRDSSKMINPSYKTADVSTDIMILSEDREIPLDTMINALELTSGDEYERIVKLLNLTDNLTFDLKLYSKSLDKYISQLSDGTFKVRIPIPENFKDKDLVVYYVGENEKTETFGVDFEDDYAVFNTNHFSIYTLGYKEPEETPITVTLDANGGKFNDTDIYTIENWDYTLYDTLVKPTREGYKFKGYYTEKNAGTKLEMILNEAGIDRNMTFYAQWEKEEKVPQTFDGITNSVLVATISLIGLVSAIYFQKKQNRA